MFRLVLHNNVNTFRSPASTAFCSTSHLTTVALTVEKNPSKRADFRNTAHIIGHFGFLLDSSASENTLSENPLSRSASDYQSPSMSPSDMINDRPVHMDCVVTIEATMDEMKSQHEATHQLLQDLLTRLGPTQAQNVQEPLPTCPACGSPMPSIPASSTSWKKLALKPSFTPDFSGDRAAGKAFLTSCQTYICLCPKVFKDNLIKIIWAMSYMKTGCTNHWVIHEFEQETKTGHLRFIDWLDFKEEF